MVCPPEPVPFRGALIYWLKLGFTSFNEAYAVLPYVYQSGVEHHAWLPATQMINDLARG
jgi:chromate transporter